jgi:hypothetical protein
LGTAHSVILIVTLRELLIVTLREIVILIMTSTDLWINVKFC